jgi:hypothetical protein
MVRSWRLARGELAVADHPGPADPQVGSKAGEGLLGALVTTEGGQSGQSAAAVGATKAADRHREAVQDRDGRVEADLAEQLLGQLGGDRPPIGRLAGEGRAVDTGKGREPVTPVATDVLVQALVGVDAPELADALDGQDFTVAQDRFGAALAQPPPGQPLLDQAVHRDEQRRSLHA